MCGGGLFGHLDAVAIMREYDFLHFGLIFILLISLLNKF